MKVELDLTKDELTVLTYLVSVADTPHTDPLKDIYEVGEDDKPEEPYKALKTMAKKIYQAAAKAK